jgi:hypothetical protein
MKQIFIEKYIQPSKISLSGNEFYWVNEFAELNSVLGHPAVVRFYNGKVTEKHWYKNGLRHREGYQKNKNLPASVYYYSSEQHWYYKNDKFVKENLA